MILVSSVCMELNLFSKTMNIGYFERDSNSDLCKVSIRPLQALYKVALNNYQRAKLAEV
jgi:hypothetical protein